MLEDVKSSSRIDGTELDSEIQDLIDAAKSDLILCGISAVKVVDTDALIKRAVILYCKANFGYEDINMSARFERAYISLKQHLSLSDEYQEVRI